MLQGLLLHQTPQNLKKKNRCPTVEETIVGQEKKKMKKTFGEDQKEKEKEKLKNGKGKSRGCVRSPGGLLCALDWWQHGLSICINNFSYFYFRGDRKWVVNRDIVQNI